MNAGNCTWYEFASKALELAGMGNRIEPISSSDYPMRARRPKDSSLESTKLNASLKECLRPWENALESYLREKGYLVLVGLKITVLQVPSSRHR